MIIRPGSRTASVARSAFLGLALAALLVAGGAATSGCGDERGDTDYDVEFWVLGEPVLAGAIQFEIEYLGDHGSFIGRGDKVDCEALVDAISAANFIGERTVKVGLISLEGIRVPNALLRCGFRTDGNVGVSSFDVRVTDAADTDSQPLDPLPGIQSTSVVAR